MRIIFSIFSCILYTSELCALRHSFADMWPVICSDLNQWISVFFLMLYNITNTCFQNLPYFYKNIIAWIRWMNAFYISQNIAVTFWFGKQICHHLTHISCRFWFQKLWNLVNFFSYSKSQNGDIFVIPKTSMDAVEYCGHNEPALCM